MLHIESRFPRPNAHVSAMEIARLEGQNRKVPRKTRLKKQSVNESFSRGRPPPSSKQDRSAFANVSAHARKAAIRHNTIVYAVGCVLASISRARCAGVTSRGPCRAA